MGVLVLFRDISSNGNRFFSVLCFSIVIWLTATAMGYMSKDANTASSWFKIDNFGVMFISPSFFAFSSYLVGKKRRFWILTGFSIAFLFGLVNFTHSFISDGATKYFWGFFPRWKIIHSIPFFLFWFGYSLASFITLKKAIKESASGSEINKIKFVILAFSIAYIGSIDYLATFGIEFYPLGFIPIFFLVSIIFYAIVKHRLMDFDLIMRWGLAYGTSFFLIGVLFFFGVFIIERFINQYMNIGKGLPSLTAACIAVLVFEPLRKKIVKWVDRIIFKSPDFQYILSGIQKELRNPGNLETITNGLIQQFKKIWNVNHAGLLVWNFSKSQYELFPKEAFHGQIIDRINEKILKGDFLIRTLESERRLFKYGIVVEEELTALGNKTFKGERTTFWKIRRTMRWIGASVCVPLMWGDYLIGLIVLGSKKNNALYNNEDKKFLSHVSLMISEVFNMHLSKNNPVPINTLDKPAIQPT